MMIKIHDLVIKVGLFGSIWEMSIKFILWYVSKCSWLYATIDHNTEKNISILIPVEETKPLWLNN